MIKLLPPEKDVETTAILLKVALAHKPFAANK